MHRSKWLQSVALSLSLLGGVFGNVMVSRADYTATVDTSVNWGVWEGWGCSLCWWANQFGTRDDLADIVFTRNNVAWSGTTLPGLGMNVVRYNIGGFGTNSIGGTVPKISPNMPEFKKIFGFQTDWYSSDPASSSFNWNLDSNQRNMLWKARDRGANVFEAFSNSPMWWMNYNKSTAGSDNGSSDALQSWNYTDFARYLAIVVKYAATNWGVNFQYVQPFNEPAETWWQYPKEQEGAHFDNGTQRQVINALRSELNSRGLQSVGIAASDENSEDRALSTWNNFDTTTKNNVAKVNTHSYSGLAPYRGGNRGPLRTATAGKKLWMSEYGDTDASGMTMADTIVRDLYEMHPSSWVYWQPLDSGAWGLIQSNPGDNWIGSANPKYHVFAQFSRHIRQGMTIYKSSDKNTVIAYDSVAHKLIVVTVNFGTAQWINYDLARFGTVSGPITRWATITGGTDRYQSYNDTNLSGKRFWSWFPANTVQTFEVSGVYL